tara:strand:+ start:119 stop:304 length:186 start_codon:yes stop_codon:yes gene_type:complete
MGVLQTVDHSEKWKMWVVSNWIKAQKLYPSKPHPFKFNPDSIAFVKKYHREINSMIQTRCD